MREKTVPVYGQMISCYVSLFFLFEIILFLSNTSQYNNELFKSSVFCSHGHQCVEALLDRTSISDEGPAHHTLYADRQTAHKCPVLMLIEPTNTTLHTCTRCLFDTFIAFISFYSARLFDCWKLYSPTRRWLAKQLISIKIARLFHWCACQVVWGRQDLLTRESFHH